MPRKEACSQDRIDRIVDAMARETIWLMLSDEVIEAVPAVSIPSGLVPEKHIRPLLAAANGRPRKIHVLETDGFYTRARIGNRIAGAVCLATSQNLDHGYVLTQTVDPLGKFPWDAHWRETPIAKMFEQTNSRNRIRPWEANSLRINPISFQTHTR